MDSKKTIVTVEKVDNDYIFTSNKKIADSQVTYNLKSIKEIFQLNPIPSIDLYSNGEKQSITFDTIYDVEQQTFFIVMYMGDEAINKEELTLVEMLYMLLDSYIDNVYISSNKVLSSKISRMVNEYTINLLKIGKVPNMKFAIEGEGIIKANNQKVALFDRVMINPKENSMLLCEVVGEIPSNIPCKIEIKTSIGITIDIDHMYLSNESESGKLMDIEYREMLYNTANESSLLKDMILLPSDSFDFKTPLNVLETYDLLTVSRYTLIKSCVQELNKTNDCTILEYIKEKEKIFSNTMEDHLISQVDDLFDDLF